MKTKNTKTNKLILIIVGLLLTANPISLSAFKCLEKKLTVNDVKKELKSVTPTKEREIAKNIEVKKDGIKYNGSFIPKTDSNDYKVLTVRLTVYWARGSGTDSDSRRLRSSTGYTLKQGDSIAVDPRIIPYDKEVIIPNVGLVKAVDTGSAVKDKVASGGKMPVIDVFFLDKKDAERFANNNPKIVKVAVLN
jgi:3D (Asp-Asp-Asp) domain-containing protein